ncbi:MAG: type II toxin-antitoxin system RelE/ParE family toxin [Patescibacteria group bacterium]
MYIAVISEKLNKILKKQKHKNPQVVSEIQKQIDKVLRFPEFGKPLRHDMKNERRIHIGSFVLVYKIWKNEIHFLDFEHHDKVYKRK